MPHHDIPEERLCSVCGHPIGPYLTICDKCGSIQRHSKGDGIGIPPEKLGTCDICGEKAQEGETLCTKCAERGSRETTVRKIPRSKRLKISSALFAVSSLLFLVAMVGCIVSSAGIGLIITFAILGGSMMLVSLGVLMLARTPKETIEVYPHISGDEE